MTAAVIEIVLLNLMLAGDGAMFLAVATKALPQAQRRLGVNLGAILLMVSRGAVLVAAMSLAPLPGFGLFCAAALIAAASSRRGAARGRRPRQPNPCAKYRPCCPRFWRRTRRRRWPTCWRCRRRPRATPPWPGSASPFPFPCWRWARPGRSRFSASRR